jgi:hypothetical protein
MFLNDAVTGWTWHRLQPRRRRESAKAAAVYDATCGLRWNEGWL